MIYKLEPSDNMAKSWIYASFSDEMNTHITCKGTTYEQWKSLEGTFLGNYQSRILALYSQLQTHRKDGLNFNEYIAKAKTISHQLAIVG